MRSGSGTNFGLTRSVVAFTKSRIAFFDGLSFHEGNGSSAAETTRLADAAKISAAEPLNKSLRVTSIFFPFPGSLLTNDDRCRQIHFTFSSLSFA